MDKKYNWGLGTYFYTQFTQIRLDTNVYATGYLWVCEF